MRWPLEAADYRWAVVEVFAGSRLLAVAPPPRGERCRGVRLGDNRRSLLAMHEASFHPSSLYAASLGMRAYRAASMAGAVERLLEGEVVA